MRFIKRLIFVVFLLVVAFLVYRLVSPKAAKELLFDLKSFSNDTIGTHFSLSGKVLESTGAILNVTGAIVELTGDSQDTGADEILLNDALIFQDTGSAETSTEPSTPAPTPTPTPAPKPTTTSSSSSNGLSSKDMTDLKNLLKNFQ